MNSRCETGAASVVAAAMVAVLLTVSGGGFLLGAVVIARHRAQAVADLAALAGAGRISAGPGAACAQAHRLAVRMGIGESDCAVDGLDVVVTVTVALPGPRLGPVRATARAGPSRQQGQSGPAAGSSGPPAAAAVAFCSS